MPGLRQLPGTADVLAAQRDELPELDWLCGPFWGLVAIRALVPGGGFDQEAVAAAAGSTLAPGDGADDRPPGEPARTDYRIALPIAAERAIAGTSAGGLARAIEELSGGTLVAVPATGAWDAEQLRTLLSRLAERTAPVVCVANYFTAPLWPHWDVGHFSALVGLVEEPVGTLVVVADSYPSLGAGGVHHQPLERMAAALRRDGTSLGGVLLVADATVRGDLQALVAGVGLECRLWDNGAVDARAPQLRKSVS